MRELISYGSYRIKYEGLKTKSLFYAPVTQRFYLPGTICFEKKRGDSPVLKKAQGVGFQYQLRFLEVNYADERVRRLLRQRAWKDTPENSFAEICSRFEEIRFGGGTIADSDIREMERYTAALERPYLQRCG